MASAAMPAPTTEVEWSALHQVVERAAAARGRTATLRASLGGLASEACTSEAHNAALALQLALSAATLETGARKAITAAVERVLAEQADEIRAAHDDDVRQREAGFAARLSAAMEERDRRQDQVVAEVCHSRTLELRSAVAGALAGFGPSSIELHPRPRPRPRRLPHPGWPYWVITILFALFAVGHWWGVFAPAPPGPAQFLLLGAGNSWAPSAATYTMPPLAATISSPPATALLAAAAPALYCVGPAPMAVSRLPFVIAPRPRPLTLPAAPPLLAGPAPIVVPRPPAVVAPRPPILPAAPVPHGAGPAPVVVPRPPVVASPAPLVFPPVPARRHLSSRWCRPWLYSSSGWPRGPCTAHVAVFSYVSWGMWGWAVLLGVVVFPAL